MSNASLVTLALEVLKCRQKDLATRLGVSPAQISKWKRDEYMSAEMSAKLNGLLGLDGREPQFVRLAGSLEDAVKWERLLRSLADWAAFGAETGYHTYRLEDEDEADLLYWHTFSVLEQMGIDIPKPFPAALEFDDEDTLSDEEDERRDHVILAHPLTSLILSIYKSYTDVYGFYAAYVSNVIDELDLFDTPFDDIEPCLLALAAAKLDVEPAIAGNFREFRRKTLQQYTDSLTCVKTEAFRAGLPLRAELLDMVNATHDAMGHAAEAESLGFNDARLHPDIYMNELLVGMRVIHQVLPAIMQKLGIEQDFKLDRSELSLN
ncbi:MAG: helix-turn-helix transcriptional regulator [Hydrogenophaga sp.]|uniref:helix-turn-helix domain-containing protein n=1 Tax=Hydrogenophaga sp. TaxID=1904254 RepID=UPI0025BD75E0|nr:helix-turn-helix transcriptional regulator [Hydrogenophaga sp.]MBU7571928.1 helix-turn-helix transcriptional regulator [Hydrogenophaga sp.]